MQISDLKNFIAKSFRKFFTWNDFIRSKKGFLGIFVMHLLSMVIILFFILIFIFYLFLPVYTRHNKWIIVPDLNGIHIDEVQKFLKIKKLKYSIKEKKNYSNEYPANVVLFQNPITGSKVKKNRTIYVSLNSDTPPLIEMPDLLHGSVRNAQVILKNNDLKLGYVRYVSNIAKNTILKQFYNNKIIVAGELIPKGAKVNLVIGAGLGKIKVIMPSILDKTLSEAEDILKVYGLQIGSVIYSNNVRDISHLICKENKNASNFVSNKEIGLETEKKPQSNQGTSSKETIMDGFITQEPCTKKNEKVNVETSTSSKEKQVDLQNGINTIFKQIPAPSKLVRHGSVVDIWIYKPISISKNV